jgi:hypothetical protein
VYRRQRGIPKNPRINGPHYFVTSAFGEFGVTTPLSSRSGQRRADYIVNPTAMKEPEGSLDLRFWLLRGSGLRGFWLYCHSILPKQDFARSTVCRSLLLDDRTVGGAPNDLPKSTTLFYFVTSAFGEFDAIASPFSRSGTSPKSSWCRSTAKGIPEHS